MKTSTPSQLVIEGALGVVTRPLMWPVLASWSLALVSSVTPSWIALTLSERTASTFIGKPLRLTSLKRPLASVVVASVSAARIVYFEPLWEMRPPLLFEMMLALLFETR
ncbi:hypothetical protein D3C86_969090 [compost metagenome]